MSSTLEDTGNISENINDGLDKNPIIEFTTSAGRVIKRTSQVIAIGVGAPILIVGCPFIGIGINMVNLSVCWISTPFIGGFEYIGNGNLDYTKSYLHESLHFNERLIDVYWNLRNEMQNALNDA